MEYIDVKADDLTEGAATYEWVIKWGSGYADETITIELINVAGLEAPETEVTLELNTDTACPGDSIVATGTADANNWVSIKVLDEAGNVVFFDATRADAEGNYSLTFKVPYVAPGTLTVVAGYGDNVATKELEVKEVETFVVTFEKGVAPIGQTTMYVQLVGVDNHSDYKVFYNGVEMTYSEPRDAFRMFVPETLTEEEAKAKLTYQEPEPPGTISYAITFEKGVAPIGQTTMYVKLVGVDNHSDYKVFYDGVEMTYSEPRDAFRMFVPETTTKESAVGKLTNVKI
jgi:type 1 fimbria pilin